jgi:membrane protein YdbS with pleckstrin-like domain
VFLIFGAVWAVAVVAQSSAAVASAMPLWRMKFSMMVSLDMAVLVVFVLLRPPRYQSWRGHRARCCLRCIKAPRRARYRDVDGH